MNFYLLIRKYGLLTITFLMSVFMANGQYFQNYYGGTALDQFNTAVRLSNGDILAAGTTASAGAGGQDILVVRYDQQGNIIWQKVYGTASYEVAYSSTINSNGNVVIAGTIGPAPPNNTTGTNIDLLVIEVNPTTGVLNWSRRISNSSNLNEAPHKIITTTNGLAVVGYNDIPGSLYPDYLVFGLSSDGGSILWQKTIDNNGSGDIGYGIVQTSDGGYAVVGGSYTYNNYDQVLLRLDNSGTLLSNYYFGSSADNEAAQNVLQLSNGDLMILGSYRALAGVGLEIALTRITSNNAISWTHTFGDKGVEDDNPYSFQTTSSGGYVIAGYTTKSSKATKDMVLITTDGNGNLISSSDFGGTLDDIGNSVLQNADNGFTLIGSSNSFGAGDYDGGFIVTDQNGNVAGNCNSYNALQTNIDLGQLRTGIISFTTSNPGYTNNSVTLSTNSISMNVLNGKQFSVDGYSQVCVGIQNTYTTNPSSLSVSWSITPTFTEVSKTPNSITYNFSSSGTYNLTASYAGECATKSITSNTQVSLSIDLNSQFCVGDLDTLKGSPSGGTFTVDGISATTFNPQIVGSHTIVYNYPGCNASTTRIVNAKECCLSCIPTFSPIPGQKYTISGWVKENISPTPAYYSNSNITVTFDGSNITVGPFAPSSSTSIIDGWQRIEGTFTVPSGSTKINVNLNNLGTADVFFDDIRIHPADANLKSFVYDPITQRLVAELDENNYATLYEYDEEGKLIRVKKETERGIMTIKETRSNLSK